MYSDFIAIALIDITYRFYFYCLLQLKILSKWPVHHCENCQTKHATPVPLQSSKWVRKMASTPISRYETFSKLQCLMENEKRPKQDIKWGSVRTENCIQVFQKNSSWFGGYLLRAPIPYLLSQRLSNCHPTRYGRCRFPISTSTDSSWEILVSLRKPPISRAPWWGSWQRVTSLLLCSAGKGSPSGAFPGWTGLSSYQELVTS